MVARQAWLRYGNRHVTHSHPSRRSFIRSAGGARHRRLDVGSGHPPRPARRRASPGGHRLRGPRRRQPGVGGRRAHRGDLRRRSARRSPRWRPRIPRRAQEVDFRRLFDHAGEFDAVVVSTAEHTHAFATLPALQLKKHVYCEKPLTYNVQEARIIREAAARAGVATQMGTQIHAGDNYRRVVELVQSGAIGTVTRVPRLGRARLGPARQRGRGQGRCRHRVRAGPPDDGRSGACRPRVGSLARPCAGPPVQPGLRARARSGIAGGTSATGR